MMRNFTDEERALLTELVPTAQHLIKIDELMLRAWLWQLTDHERSLLMIWAAHQGSDWVTAPIDPPESTREIGGQE